MKREAVIRLDRVVACRRWVLVGDGDRRRVLALSSWFIPLVVLSLVLASALSSAAVPDQIWLPGIYDLVDNDVLARLAYTAADSPPALASIDPARLAAESLLSPPAAARAEASLARVHLRSPPAA